MGISVALISIFVVFKTLQVHEITMGKMQIGKRGQRVRPVLRVHREELGGGGADQRASASGGSTGRTCGSAGWPPCVADRSCGARSGV